MHLIADRLIELEQVEAISDETVRTTLKCHLKPWQQECFYIPPEGDAAFVAAREDVLDLYALPPDPARPLVCLDEFCKQLLSEVAPPQNPAPGRPGRHNAEYLREGSASAFMI